MNEPCIFCEIVAGKSPAIILYQDDQIIVFKDLHAQSSIHWLVVTKQHFPEFTDLPDDLLQTLFIKAKHIITEQKITSYRLVNNSLKTALVPHFHLHILGNVEKFRRL